MSRSIERSIWRSVRSARAPLLAAALAAAAVFGGAGAARAELVVCADIDRPIEVALARWEKNRFVARGWFAVGARSCRTLIALELHRGKYYLYARAQGGVRVWPAQAPQYRPICVDPAADFRHREWSSLGPQCPQGFEQRRFEAREATTGRLTVHFGGAR
jgi:uncharacterized membrane protein